MIVVAGLILGAILGAVTAKARGGKTLDLLQYAAGFGIAFSILGVFLTIFIERMVS
jgi:cytochrome c biogenesis protein CcdA